MTCDCGVPSSFYSELRLSPSSDIPLPHASSWTSVTRYLPPNQTTCPCFKTTHCSSFPDSLAPTLLDLSFDSWNAQCLVTKSGEWTLPPLRTGSKSSSPCRPPTSFLYVLLQKDPSTTSHYGLLRVLVLFSFQIPLLLRFPRYRHPYSAIAEPSAEPESGAHHSRIDVPYDTRETSMKATRLYAQAYRILHLLFLRQGVDLEYAPGLRFRPRNSESPREGCFAGKTDAFRSCWRLR